MRKHQNHTYLFSEGGIHCPLCGGRMARRSLFCSHCRRHGRFHLESSGIRPEAKSVYLPRGMLRLPG